MLDSNSRQVVDHLIPDYSILDEIEYKYPAAKRLLRLYDQGLSQSLPGSRGADYRTLFPTLYAAGRQVRGIEELVRYATGPPASR